MGHAAIRAICERAFVMLTSQRQGDLGEASALEWLLGRGAQPFIPFGHSANCDLMAEFEGRPARIQVKTSRHRKRTGWEVALVTRGGNQSWSGVSKLFSASRCEFPFVLVADGRRWFIPSTEITAEYSIVVGPSKWSQFEIERGRAFAAGA